MTKVKASMKTNMKKFGTENLWRGLVNGHKQVVNVVGTYGDGLPIVRIERGPDAGKAMAINWGTGEVVKEVHLK